MMSSSSVSPDETPIHQAPGAGVPPAHVAASPGGRRPDASPPIEQAPTIAAVGLLEERSGRQARAGRHSRVRRPPLQRRDVAGRRRDESPDRHQLSPKPGGRHRPPQRQRGGLFSISWVDLLVLVFLTYNAGMAIYQSWADVAEISAIVFTYLNMVSIFFCIRTFQAEPANSTGRNGHRVSLWILTMSLTFGFVYRVMGATTKPTLQAALLLWAMPAATGIAATILFLEDRSDAPLEEELLDV